MLVTAWITIIDGGKNKRTPPWAKWLGRFQYVGQYIAEVIGGNLEYVTGDGVNYAGGMNTYITYYKYWFNLQHWCIYMYVRERKRGATSEERKKVENKKRGAKRRCSLSVLLSIL